MNRFRRISSVSVVAVAAVLFAVLAGCSNQQPQTRQARSRGVPAAAPGTYHTAPPAVASAPYVVPMQSYQPTPLTEIPAQPSWQPVSGRTVIIDAGHGGTDPGASHYGLVEKDVNLDLANRTANLLRARGCTVVMTRSSDTFVPLPERSAIANRHPNAAFVSIHCNAAPGYPEATGVESFILAGDVSDRARAEAVRNRYKAGGGMDTVQGKQALATLATQSRARGPALANSLQRSLCSRLGENDRGVQHRDLAVLRETYFGPAALVEVGFMTNARTAQQMRTEEWRRRTAEGLCEGICAFLQQP